MVVGNIVRRVLGMIRDEAKEDRNDENSGFSDSASSSQVGSPSREPSASVADRPTISSSISTFSPLRHSALGPLPNTEIASDDTLESRASQEQTSRPPLMTSHTSYAVLNGVPVQQSMFNLLSATPSPMSTPPGTHSPVGKSTMNGASLSNRISSSTRDLKGEIIEGVGEIIDELGQVDEQIAAYAQEHIHSNEIILTHSSSRTVQKFLLKAAAKRKFTVIHVESYPNDHEDTHASIMGSLKDDDEDDELGSEAFQGTLTAAGITVVLITDAAVFALMSRVNKVILATHTVMANGGLVAAAGARIIAKAAHKHRTPVIVLSGVYKLSPQYPFNDLEGIIEYGDTGKVISYEEGDLVDKVDVDNPLYDYVPPDLVDLYITNL